MKNLTEIIFILDRSGSMKALTKETICGFNSMITRQNIECGEAIVTTILFDDEYEILHNRANISYVKPITEKEYYTRGSTALLDAVGRTIGRVLSLNETKSDGNKRIIFIIITDGMENSSHEFNYSQVKGMIEAQKRKGWEFIFLGANLDAVAEAERIGIGSERTAKYYNDKRGTQINFDTVNNVIREVRKGSPIKKNWNRQIELYYAGKTGICKSKPCEKAGLPIEREHTEIVKEEKM